MQETSQIRWLSKSAKCKSGQFEFDSVINWKPDSICLSCLSRGSDGEKRCALITTRVMQLCTRCNLDMSC